MIQAGFETLLTLRQSDTGLCPSISMSMFIFISVFLDADFSFVISRSIYLSIYLLFFSFHATIAFLNIFYWPSVIFKESFCFKKQLLLRSACLFKMSFLTRTQRHPFIFRICFSSSEELQTFAWIFINKRFSRLLNTSRLSMDKVHFLGILCLPPFLTFYNKLICLSIYLIRRL